MCSKMPIEHRASAVFSPCRTGSSASLADGRCLPRLHASRVQPVPSSAQSLRGPYRSVAGSIRWRRAGHRMVAMVSIGFSRLVLAREAANVEMPLLWESPSLAHPRAVLAAA